MFEKRRRSQHNRSKDMQELFAKLSAEQLEREANNNTSLLSRAATKGAKEELDSVRSSESYASTAFSSNDSWRDPLSRKPSLESNVSEPFLMRPMTASSSGKSSSVKSSEERLGSPGRGMPNFQRRVSRSPHVPLKVGGMVRQAAEPRIASSRPRRNWLDGEEYNIYDDTPNFIGCRNVEELEEGDEDEVQDCLADDENEDELCTSANHSFLEEKEQDFFSEEECVLRDDDDESDDDKVIRERTVISSSIHRDRRPELPGNSRFYVKELRCAVKGGVDNFSTEGQGETCCERDVVVEDLSDDESGETKCAAQQNDKTHSQSTSRFYLNAPSLQRVLNGEEPIIILPVQKRRSVALGDIQGPQVWAQKSQSSSYRFSEKGSAVLLETRALHDLRLFLKGEMVVDSLLCVLRLRQLLELDDHGAVRRVGRQIYHDHLQRGSPQEVRLPGNTGEGSTHDDPINGLYQALYGNERRGVTLVFKFEQIMSRIQKELEPHFQGFAAQGTGIARARNTSRRRITTLEECLSVVDGVREFNLYLCDVSGLRTCVSMVEFWMAVDDLRHRTTRRRERLEQLASKFFLPGDFYLGDVFDQVGIDPVIGSYAGEGGRGRGGSRRSSVGTLFGQMRRIQCRCAEFVGRFLLARYYNRFSISELTVASLRTQKERCAARRRSRIGGRSRTLSLKFTPREPIVKDSFYSYGGSSAATIAPLL